MDVIVSIFDALADALAPVLIVAAWVAYGFAMSHGVDLAGGLHLTLSCSAFTVLLLILRRVDALVQEYAAARNLAANKALRHVEDAFNEVSRSKGPS